MSRSRLLVMLALVGPVVLMLWPLLSGGTMVSGDAQIYYHLTRPLRLMFLNGRLYFWNPYEFSGTPTLGDFSRAMFYPLSFPLYLLEGGPAMALSLLLHQSLCALGCYRLGRHLSLSGPASWTFAMAFTLGFWPTFHLGVLAMVAVVAWLPWLLDGACRVLDGQGPRAMLQVAVCSAMQWLAGAPQPTYYSYAAVLAVVLLHPQRRQALRVARLGLALATGLALSGAQTLPAVHIAHGTLRGAGVSLELSSSYSLTPRMLWTMVAPLCYGFDSPAGSQTGPIYSLLGGPPAGEPYHGDWSPQECTVYPGLVVWLLVGVALARGGRRARLLGALALLALWLAFGASGGLYTLAYHVIPGFAQFRGPSRLTLLAALPIALLAGLGLDALGRGRRSQLTLLGLALVLAALALAAPGPTELVPLGALALALIGLLGRSQGESRAAMTLVGLGLCLDLLWVAQGFVRSGPEMPSPIPPEVAARLSIQARGQRVVMGTGGVPGQAMMWGVAQGIQNIQGWNPIALPRYVEALFFNETGHFPEAEQRNQLVASNHLFVLRNLDSRLLALLGARYVLLKGDQGYQTLMNPKAFPRFWLAGEARLEPDGLRSLEQVQSGQVDPGRCVLLNEGTALPAAGAASPGELVSSHEDWDRAQVECRLERPGLLATNLIYEEGWQARVDGHEVHPWRAFHTLMALPLESGPHRVELSYRPPGLLPGIALSLAALALCLVWGFKGRPAA